YRAIVESLLELRDATAIAHSLRGVEHPGQLADLSGYSPDLKLRQQLEILEERNVVTRLEKLISWSREILAEQSLKDKIRSEVDEGLEKRQREFYLRQQLEAIKRELGEDEDDAASEYRRRIADTPFPDDVRKEVERELKRLERTSEQNPEQGWIRNYLDWMLDLPWGKSSADPRCGSHRARRRKGPHHRVPGGKEAPREPTAPARGRARLRRDHHPRRAAGSRQDLARRVHRPGARSEICPRLPRWNS